MDIGIADHDIMITWMCWIFLSFFPMGQSIIWGYTTFSFFQVTFQQIQDIMVAASKAALWLFFFEHKSMIVVSGSKTKDD